MKFYCVTKNSQRTTNELLMLACNKRNIEYVLADSYSKANCGDLVYRVINGSAEDALNIEEQLINDGATSFYRNFSMFDKKHNRAMDYDSSVLSRYGISVPREFIPAIRMKHIDILNGIKSLGNFPLVVKILGGSHGVGVVRVDSSESLLSLVDYLSFKNEKFVIKEFINVKRSARIIVLNGSVVDSIEYEVLNNDFRSNVGKSPKVKHEIFPTEVNDLALKAVDSLGLDFGGVDLIISDMGPLLLEVNFPCFFARAQLLTGVDISGMMIDYLLSKSKRNL